MIKKTTIIFLSLYLLFCISAQAKNLTIDLRLENNITAGTEVEFKILDESKNLKGILKSKISEGTKNLEFEFDLDSDEEKKYIIVPQKGMKEVKYNLKSFKPGEEILIDTASGFDIKLQLTGEEKKAQKAGLETNEVIFYFDVQNKGPINPSMVRFNLFSEDGQWLANEAVLVEKGGERKSITFKVPAYYTGEKFYLRPTMFVEQISYNKKVVKLGEKLEVQTYAYLDEEKKPVIGNFFHLNLVVAAQSGTATTQQQKKAAEDFINASGVDSKTNYLVWVSKKDFKTTVFLRKNNRWVFEKDFDCTIGKPSTPTITGQFEYFQYQQRWTYPNYYVGPVMRFTTNGYALHSTLLKYDGSYYDSRLRQELSLGCVRFAKEDIKWLVDYVPLKTKIYITE